MSFHVNCMVNNYDMCVVGNGSSSLAVTEEER